MDTTLNIATRDLYCTLVEDLNKSEINIESKRLILSVLLKQVEIEADKTLALELQQLKEAKNEPVME